MKHPILGDPIYGTTYEASDKYLDEIITEEERLTTMGSNRLMLHAQSLSFTYGNQFHIESKDEFKRLKSLIHPKEKREFNGRVLSPDNTKF